MIHGPTLSEVKSAMHVLTNVYSATHPHLVHVSSLNPNSTVCEFGPKLRNGLSSSTMMQIKMTQIVNVHAAMSMASTRLSSKIWSRLMLLFILSLIKTTYLKEI